ncbi:hypothetical protein, partial [Telmatospirillum sp. J64-1]|uniref:hypothetical protein n=1 Tax=Telmatospirillum sp. J64-1 TaxID=2502183 RepID=UPI00115CE055
MSADDTTTWPVGLQRLAEIVGAKAALQLADTIGGVRTPIPKKMNSDHPLAKLIGREEFAKLVYVYGGDTIEIPKGSFKRLLKAEILNAKGSTRSIALRVGCTQRYVKKLRQAT